jgi:hypothetical protein
MLWVIITDKIAFQLQTIIFQFDLLQLNILKIKPTNLKVFN